MAEQTAELAKEKLKVPVLAWGGSHSFGSHTYDSAKAIGVDVSGGVIEATGHWVFEEKTAFISQELRTFWQRTDQEQA
jgi:pimeloyl-ACP methyl ester carboxylesterase